MKKLGGNTATMGLTNVFSITIKVADDGDSVQYQFNNGNEPDEIKEAEIEYVEQEGQEEWVPAFKACDGNWYYLNEFIRDNF